MSTDNPNPAPDAPRSMADVIRAMGEAELVTLMRERPDLARPRPSSLADLVDRATSATSSSHAVERLDAWVRRVAEGLAAMPTPVSARTLASALGAPVTAVEAALGVLRRRALAWGQGRTVQLTRAAAAPFGPHPAGLALPSPMPLTRKELRAALAAADEAEHAVMQKLLWQPRGRLRHAGRPLTLATAETPTERLVARRLARAVDDEHVVLTREAALELREGCFFAEAVPTAPPPWPAVASSGAALRAHAGLGSAVAAIDLVARTVEALADLAPRTLATGGLGKRDLRALADDTDTGPTALALALARQAMLVGTHGPQWLPTPDNDRWAAVDGWTQWRTLVGAWTHLDRWPLTGVDPLLPEPTPGALGLRRAVMAELRRAPEGTLVEEDVLAARVVWRHPTWPHPPTRQAAAQVLAEADLLGVLAMGAVSPLLHAHSDPGFPATTHQFMLQADLTATPVGPLQVEVRRRLHLMTARDGLVRRFTAASVRQALDHGLTSQQMLDWLSAHSLTPPPQPLVYLVGDVARQHGQTRVAPATAVVTIEDAGLLAALLRAPEASLLGLRKVGPTAVVAQADPEEVVEVLRSLGHAPVPTDEHGEPLQTPPPRRATRVVQPPTEPEPPSADQLALVARALLAQEAPGGGDVVDDLRTALQQGDWVELTHVDARGVPTTVQARILGMHAGQMRFVVRASPPVTIPLSRVVSVRSSTMER